MSKSEGPAVDMAKRDYYEILGLARGASEQELKSAFRRLAKDSIPTAIRRQARRARFKELNEAYEVLKDPQKRAAYDHFGHAAFDGGRARRAASGPTSPPRCRTSSTTCSASSWAAGAAAPSAPGASAAPTCATTWRSRCTEAFAGKTAQIRVPTSVTCETCTGTGAKAGTKPTTCPTCGGHGKVRASQGFFTIERTCPTCQGRGEIDRRPLPGACRGAGRVTKERTLSVNIPAGVEDGTRIRLAGEGEAGLRGGPAGDLYIFLSIKPHEFFQRDGADIFCRVPISMTTAALGGQIEVPTVDGGRRA